MWSDIETQETQQVTKGEKISGVCQVGEEF